MINLLPAPYKKTISYAKRNGMMVKWIAIIIIAFTGLYLIIAAGYLYLSFTSEEYSKQLNLRREQLISQDAKKIGEDVKAIQSNVSLADSVLSQKFLYSNLLLQLGDATAQDTILSSLNVGSDDTVLALTYKAKTLQAGSNVPISLGATQQNLFKTIDLEDISCDTDSTEEYPCTVVVNALFGDNPSLRLDVTTPKKANDEE